MQSMPVLVHYWRILLRWKWVVLASLAGCIVLGLIVTLLMTPQYTASATIEIARQQDRVVQVADVTPESSFVDQEFYQTQYSLLQARSLAESVVRELKLADDDRLFDAFGVDPDESGLFADDNRRLTREERARRAKLAADVLLDNIGISPTRGSRLVTVAFTSPDAQLSASIANAWTGRFIGINLERRFEATSYARRFLEQRLEQIRQRLEASERALVGYAADQRLINIPSGEPGGSRIERPLVADDLSTLNNALAEATRDRIRAQSRGAGRASSSQEALANQAISGLRERRAEIAAEYAKMLAQFEPSYPPAEALAAQLRQLDRSVTREEGRIGENLTSELSQATARERALRDRVEGLKGDLLDQRRRSIQYNIYQREVDTNRQLYDGLLQRYKEIGVAGGVGSNNISVIDAAETPDRPSSPSLLLNMLVAIVAGVGIGAATALLLDRIDEGVKDPGDIERITGLPLLGAVPAAPSGEDAFALLQDRKSSASEAYLSIRTALQFSTDHGVPKSLAVTSTRSGEGKSTSAFAIAQSLARTAHSVVLVDCDMRSPSVHQLIGTGNESGTSNFLAGDDDLTAMFHPVGDARFSAITAGPTPPNAGELLSSPRLKLLIARLAEQFDHVVLDCPPVLGLADALLVASEAEATIYAVEAHGVRAGMIRAALERLGAADVNLIGIILTKFEAKKAHYGYGYDYGYGYGKDAQHA